MMQVYLFFGLLFLFPHFGGVISIILFPLWVIRMKTFECTHLGAYCGICIPCLCSLTCTVNVPALAVKLALSVSQAKHYDDIFVHLE